jgi:hypothetical protein
MKEVPREATTGTMRAFAYSPWAEMAGKVIGEQWYWTIEWTIKTSVQSCGSEINRPEDAFNSRGCSLGPDLTEERTIEPLQSFV